MTKKEAIALFRKEVLPAVKQRFEKDGQIDKPARCEAWNDWTDQLQKDGRITAHQYNTWTNEF